MATLGKFPHATTCSTPASAAATTARKKRVGPSFLRYFLMIIIAKNGGYFTCRSLSASLSVSHSLFLSIFRSLATISNLEGNGKETEEGFFRELYDPSWI